MRLPTLAAAAALALTTLAPTLAAAADGFPAPGETPTVELLTAGDSPREVVRYALKPGATVPLLISQQARTAMSFTETLSDDPVVIGIALAPELMPGPRDTHGLRVELSGEGDLAYGLKGMNLTATIDARGRVKGAAFSGGKPGDPRSQVELMGLAQLPVALPAEAIGHKASWEVRAASRVEGVVTNYRTIYTLGMREGDTLHLEVSREIEVPLGSVGADGKTTVDRHLALGYGVVSVNLTHPFPDEGKVTTHALTRVRNNAAQLTMANSTRMTLQRGAEGAAPSAESTDLARAGELLERVFSLQEDMLTILERHASDPDAAATALEALVSKRKAELAEIKAAAEQLDPSLFAKVFEQFADRIAALTKRSKALMDEHPELFENERVQKAMASASS